MFIDKLNQARSPIGDPKQ